MRPMILVGFCTKPVPVWSDDGSLAGDGMAPVIKGDPEYGEFLKEAEALFRDMGADYWRTRTQELLGRV